jgi:lipoyl(octanoyl) transferase
MTLSDLETCPGVKSSDNGNPSICHISWLGKIDYQSAYDVQKRIMAEKLDGHSEDSLMLLEHPPTITIGKSGKVKNLLVPREMLAAMGVSLFFTDRGGDITFHGPGQLVAYPIIDLKRRNKDIHRYISDLQEVMIETLADYGISARRDEKYVGVWVGDEKIGAIGVAIHRWVTMHGLALNINTDMTYFSLIEPCGIHDRGVTSMEKLLNHTVLISAVAESLAYHFAKVFSARIVWLTVE